MILLARSLVLILVLATLGSTRASAAEKILFLGNSLTYGLGDGNAQSIGGVSAIFDALAKAGGQGDPDVVRRAIGGKDFEFHVNSPTSQGFVSQQAWDYVVMQNITTEPTHLYDPGRSIAQHLDFGEQLRDQIIANHPASKVVLYETFARAEAHSIYTGFSTPTSFSSPEQFQQEVADNYVALATAINAANPLSAPVTVAPVGQAFKLAGGLESNPSPEFISLHSADHLHGNDNGYYLAAAVIYATIYESSPVGLAASSELSALNLNLSVNPVALEEAAWDTVVSAGISSVQLLVESHLLTPSALAVDFSVSASFYDRLVFEVCGGLGRNWAEDGTVLLTDLGGGKFRFIKPLSGAEDLRLYRVSAVDD